MWVADFSTPGGVVRVTTGGVATRFPVPTGTPIDVIAGSDGNIWYAGQGTAVGKVTPGGVATPYVAKGVDPFGIALGPDGAVWFAEFQANAVGRVDKAGLTSHVTGMTGTAGPRYVAPGPGNTIWFTEETGNRVGRVTASCCPAGAGAAAAGARATRQAEASKLTLSARRVRRAALSDPLHAVRAGERDACGRRVLRGRKVGGRCVKVKRSNRTRQRCTRFVRIKPTIRSPTRRPGRGG